MSEALLDDSLSRSIIEKVIDPSHPFIEIPTNGLPDSVADGMVDISLRSHVRRCRDTLHTISRSVGKLRCGPTNRLRDVGTVVVVFPGFAITAGHCVATEVDHAANDRAPFLHGLLSGREAVICFSKDGMSETYQVVDIVYYSPDTDLDLAILKFEDPGPVLRPPVRLYCSPLYESDYDSIPVCTIGYPMTRSQAPLSMLSNELLGTKILSPGHSLATANEFVLTHDASTTAGNSGSVVLSLKHDCRAVAIHVRGLAGSRNEAMILGARYRHVIPQAIYYYATKGEEEEFEALRMCFFRYFERTAD